MAARAMPSENRPRAVPTAEGRRPKESSLTCIVGCKLPNGLHLQLSRMEDSHESTMGGVIRNIKVGRFFGERYTLNGTRLPFGVIPDYIITSSGYALTSGIPRDFMDEWLRVNHDSDAVNNKLIIVQNDEASVRAQSSELKDVKSGLEPIDPANPPRSIGRHKHITIGPADAKGT